MIARWTLGHLQRLIIAVAVALGGLVTLAGCSHANPEAWVRGTNVVLTNATDATVQVGTVVGQVARMPETQDSPLASGSSLNVTDDWDAAAATSVAFRITFGAGDVLEILVENPPIGTPSVAWREGPYTWDWFGELSPIDTGSATFGENSTQTIDMEGHSVTVTRGSDDGDNKNWTITLDG